MNENSVSKQVLLAFRLGWSISECLGRARLLADGNSKIVNIAPKELQGFAENEAPRLTYSNRYFSDVGAWYQAAHRVMAFAEQLDMLEVANESISEFRLLLERIYVVTFGTPQAQEQLPTPRGLYDSLEPWSRQVGERLAAKSDQAALAFTVGGELADTYWFMRTEYGLPRDKQRQDSWHQLLNYKRLTKLIDRIQEFEEYLPPFVGTCLRYSLYRWMVAHDLEYQQDHLTLVRERELKDQQVEREKSEILKVIKAEDEMRIAQKLREQAQVWQNLILGTRVPESYLSKAVRRQIWRGTLWRYGLAMIGVVLGVTLLGYFFIGVVGGGLAAIVNVIWTNLTPKDAQSETLKDSLDIVVKTLPLLSSGLIFVISVLRWGWQLLQKLLEGIEMRLKTQAVQHATWVDIGLASENYQKQYWRKTN